ncbi:SWIM zinc finger domain-containing protein [Paenibacillus sp. DCT19]|uniref:SWIM zinc finger family protein n=1 Tax=Paenibacillus sp. DCT19 TaxID=2211212 RepID=UPI000FE200A1|nr:SWIM zinc finger family protein [Paenibacillus sp. DCT19]
MMNIPNEMIMDDAQWQQLIREIADHFDNLTIMRGFQYYKQKRVGPLTFTEQQGIHAMVQGTEEYEVLLSMQSLPTSDCSCPVHSSCKHMIAVLMSYAESTGRPVHALVNAHSSTALKQSVKPTPAISSVRSDFETRAQELETPDNLYSQIKEQAMDLAQLPIPEWHKLFRSCLSRLGIGTANTSYIQAATDELYAIKPKLSPGMDQLFDLHVHMYLMRFCIPGRNPNTNSPVYLSYPAQLAVDTLQRNIEQELNRPLDLSNLDEEQHAEHWKRLEETVTYLRKQMMSETSSIMVFTSIYRDLWLNWLVPHLHQQDELEAELTTLRELEHKLSDNSVSTSTTPGSVLNMNPNSSGTGTSITKRRPPSLPLPLVLAQGWICFHLKRDAEAWQILTSGSSAYGIPPEHVLHFLHVLVEQLDWNRLGQWLAELGPLLANRRNDPLHDYMQLWDTVIQELPETEDTMWNTLVSMLPHSRPAYEDALHRRSQWRRWIDFQLSTGAEPLEFRVAVLQPIEKDAPELLLPFYHQAVERYIGHKNRDGYKAAVKLLKRLAKLYKKLKQEERWEQFITALAVRNSRLRALQEELRKGKLIS